MTLRRRLPNELCAEIVEAMHLKPKFKFSNKLNAKKLGACSSFDKYVLDSVGRSPIIFANFWDYKYCDPSLMFSKNGLKVMHSPAEAESDSDEVEPGSAQAESGSVRSKFPVPRKLKHGIFYFELTIKKSSQLNVGLTVGQDLPDIVGFSADSCGYNDTCRFAVAEKNYDYGPEFFPADLIGCGVDLATKKLFFTRNGKFLGPATFLPEWQVDWFPTITLMDYTTVETNFGRKPFKHFDFDPKIFEAEGPNRWTEALSELDQTEQCWEW